jgi:uncharacterized membrane protein
MADDLTNICGSVPFLVFHIFFFFGWITANIGLYEPTIPVFDPYPFGFLTMCVSLEAIFLAIFILVSQNRSSYVSTIREEVHLRVNLIAEEEITKILHVLAEMRAKMGIRDHDPMLQEMLNRTDTNYIERTVVDQMEKASKPLSEQLRKEFPELLMYPVKKPIEMFVNAANGGSKSGKKS